MKIKALAYSHSLLYIHRHLKFYIYHMKDGEVREDKEMGERKSKENRTEKEESLKGEKRTE